MKPTLEELVQQWIRAEFAFRYGSQRYSATAQAWLLEAEDKLRRRVTGKGELGKAANRLCCKSDIPSSKRHRWDPRRGLEEPKPIERKRLLRKKKRPNSLSLGLFG